MAVVKVLLSIIYVVLGIAISVVIGGMADSYWSKNKGRSMEGALEHFTRYGAIVFMILTLVLNILMKTQG